MGYVGTSSWGLGRCFRSSWEMRPELGHWEHQQLGHKNIGISAKASGSRARVLSRGSTLLESTILEAPEPGSWEVREGTEARAQARDDGDLNQVWGSKDGEKGMKRGRMV